jgi:hypothetical protein
MWIAVVRVAVIGVIGVPIVRVVRVAIAIVWVIRITVIGLVRIPVAVIGMIVCRRGTSVGAGRVAVVVAIGSGGRRLSRPRRAGGRDDQCHHGETDEQD